MQFIPGDAIGPRSHGDNEEKDEDLSNAQADLAKAINDLTARLQRDAAADAYGNFPAGNF